MAHNPQNRIAKLEETLALRDAEIARLKAQIEKLTQEAEPPRDPFYQEKRMVAYSGKREKFAAVAPILFQIIFFFTVLTQAIPSMVQGWFLPVFFIFMGFKVVVIYKVTEAYLHWFVSYGVLLALATFHLIAFSDGEPIVTVIMGTLFFYTALIATVQVAILSAVKLINRIQ